MYRAPAIEVLRRYPREVLLAAAADWRSARRSTSSPHSYLTCGTRRFGVSREFLLGAVMTA